MKMFRNQNYYEILEIRPNASYKEIEEAYRRAKETYSGEAPATYSLFTAEECKEISDAIEMAYKTLSFSKSREEYDRRLSAGIDVRDFRYYTDTKEAIKPSPPATEQKEEKVMPSYHAVSKETDLHPPQESAPHNDTETYEGVEFNGKMLKLIRERKGMSLNFIAEKTRISIIYLEHIEGDKYQHLPAEVYLKNYLMQYARAIGLDPKRVVEDYMKFYGKA
jgi:curved DNA-binding protein CbpA